MTKTSCRIPPPTDGRNVAEWQADMVKLAADPRTAGNANRPAWLVARVLNKKGNR